MKPDILWLPLNLFAPDSYAEDMLFFNAPMEADDSTFKTMVQLNQAALDFVEGKLDAGTYCDMLDQYGVEPEEFLQNAEKRVGLR